MSIVESSETNNTNSVTVDVKPTKALRVAYIATNGCSPFGGCYPPLTELDQMVSQSNEFITATYPVDPVARYSGTLLNLGYIGDAVPCLGVHDDIISIGIWGFLSGFNKAVGVVPQDYFTYHALGGHCRFVLPGSTGISHCNSRGGLAAEGYWTAAAHELGHMHGLACDTEEYTANPPGNPASGFWVSRGKEILIGNYCFMGNAPLHDIDDRWIDNPHYIQLFKSFLVTPRCPFRKSCTSRL